MRIALYPRVSTQEQAMEGYSIGEQIDRMTKYCGAMGWTVYKVYTDAGFSGANTDRPGLQKMIKDIQAGKIDKVLVYKLDRLSRSQLDTLYLIEKVFLENNVDFVSMSENFDTSTAFGRAMIGILAVFAQLEREQIKERMSMGREARAKQGKFHGSCNTPIGYDYIDGKLVVNEFERIQVQRMFQEYASGKSANAIATDLNKEGYRHNGHFYHAATVSRLLSRKTYLGLTKHNDTYYPGEHESIIDADLFEKVQAIKEKTRIAHTERNFRPGKATSYLGGLMYCAQCGAKYSKTSTVKQAKIQRSYYVCNSRSQKSKLTAKSHNCKNKIWRMDDLDGIIFDEIGKLATDPDYIAETQAKKPVDDRPEIIQAELEKIDTQLTRLMDLYTVGSMPVDILQDRVHKLDEQKHQLENELEKIEHEQKEKLSQADAMTAVKSFADVLASGDYNNIRTVISTLIDRIVIDDENIDIYWNFT